MSDEAEDQGDGIVEDGGVVRDFSPIDPRHRTWASRVQRAFERIIGEFRGRFGVVDPSPTEEAGTVGPWKPPDDPKRR